MADDKLNEFRTKNIELLKSLEASTARIAELESAQQTPDPRIATLEGELEAARTSLAAEKAQREALDPRVTALEAELTTAKTALEAEAAERAAAQAKASDATARANRAAIHDVIRPAALALGVIPAALPVLLENAEKVFAVEGDAIVAKPGNFSAGKPGEQVTPDEWVFETTQTMPFLYGPSAGGGASGSKTFGARVGGAKELVDPTPKQLGQFAREIAAGTVRVVSSSN